MHFGHSHAIIYFINLQTKKRSNLIQCQLFSCSMNRVFTLAKALLKSPTLLHLTLSWQCVRNSRNDASIIVVQAVGASPFIELLVTHV